MADEGQFDRHEDHVVVPRIRKIAYGLGDVGQRLLNDTFNNNHLTLYNILLGYDARTVGYARSLPILLDAFTDPLMGQISDNTRTRWGRRRPYVLFGGMFAGLAAMALWLAPAGLSPGKFFAYLLIATFIYSMISKSAFIPYGALGLELSIDYNERTRVQAYRTFFAVLIGSNLASSAFFIANQESLFSNPATGLRWVGCTYAILAIGFLMLVFAGTREEREIQSQPRVRLWTALKTTCSNKPFLVVLLSLIVLIVGVFSIVPIGPYISIYYVFGGNMKQAAFLGMLGGFITNGLTILLLPVFTAWAVRVGKKKIYVLCTAWLAATFLITLFIYNPKYPYLMLIFSTLIALPLNGINLMPFAMIADVCDLDELETGCRREGAFNGVLSLLFKVSLVFPPMVVGWIVHLVGFVPGAAEQAPGAMMKMRLIFAFAPTVMLGIAAGIAAFYPLTEERVRSVRAVLEERRQARLSAAPVEGGKT